MCANCVSAFDAAAFQAAGAVAALVAGWRRLGLRCGRRVTGGPGWAYERNATFVASLGLDPRAVLGPPPAVGSGGTPYPGGSGGTPYPGGEVDRESVGG